MNRETWRKVKSMTWQEADRLLHEIYDPEIEKTRAYAYKNAFACVFSALHQRFPDWDGQMLHSIAVDTVDFQRSFLTPEELIQQLYDDTGFDIRLKVEDQPLEYIGKGEDEDDQSVYFRESGDN